MKKALLIALCSFSLIVCVFAQWQETDKGLYGGHIGGLFVDPVTNLLFAGTGNCGVFVSSDDGQHWKTSNNGFPPQVYNIESFVRSGKNLFAGCSFIEGVFMSADNGKTWVNKKNGMPESVAVHCLTLSGTKLFAGTFNGIYKSTDNGNNWTAVNNGLAQMDQIINALVVKDGKLFAGSQGGIFVSGDDGGTWTKINLGIDNEFIQCIAVDGDYIYAGAPLGKFCISSDNGVKWTVVKSGLPFAVDFKFLTVKNGVIYAGTTGGGVWVSPDKGHTWKQFKNELSKKTINKLAIKGDKIFAATETGVYLSTDNCNSWKAVNNELTNVAVTCTIRSGRRLIAGTRGNGIFSSDDNGKTWAPINIKTTYESPWVFALSAKDNYVIAGMGDGEYLSTDNGLTWEKGNFSLPDNYCISVEETVIIRDSIFAVTSLGVYISVDKGKNWTTNGAMKDQGLFTLANKGDTLYAGTCAGIFMSTNLGISWTDINNGLVFTDNCIWSIGTKDNNLFITSNAGVFVSNNNGNSWTAANKGLRSLAIPSITINRNNLFICDNSNGVYLSSNEGTNWDPVNSGLEGPALVANSLCVIGNDVYAGTDKGLWKRPLSEFLSLNVSPASLNIEPLENSKASFNITSNTDWSISSIENWLTLSQVSGSGNSTIDLVASQNDSKEQRKAEITVSGFEVKSQSILVAQKGNPDKVKKNDIVIYPNPATDHLGITLGEDYYDPGYTLKISNVLGIVVFENRINQSRYELNIRSWNMKGTYVMQIYNNFNKVMAARTIIVR